VIDQHTRECLTIDVAGNIRSGRLIEVLRRRISKHGATMHLEQRPLSIQCREPLLLLQLYGTPRSPGAAF
jgi:hypothetical protein